jgi:hypothetical protein
VKGGSSLLRSLSVAYMALVALLPVYVDCILTFRLYAAYPYQSVSRARFLIISFPLAIFKVARITNLILFLIGYSNPNISDGKAEPPLQILWQGSVLLTNSVASSDY